MEYYIFHVKYARRVRIDSDALIYIERDKFKCDKIYLECVKRWFDQSVVDRIYSKSYHSSGKKNYIKHDR